MAATTVADLMSREVITLDRNDELSLADTRMSERRIRHLPVLDDDGMVVGIITQRDLFHNGLMRALGYGTYAKEKTMRGLLVKEVMTTDVVMGTPGMRLSEAAKLMIDKQIGCLPIVEKERLVGLLTEGDFVAAAIDT